MSNEDFNEDENDRHLCKESDLEESDCSVDIPRSERKHRSSVFEFIDRTMASAHASKWVKDRFDAFSDKDGFFPTMSGLMCQTLEFFEMTLELGEYKGRVVYEAFAARKREASSLLPQNSGVGALTHQPQLKVMSDQIDGNGIMNEHRAVALYNSRKNCSGGYIKEKAKEMMLVKKPRVTYEMLTKQEENVPVLNKIVNEVLKIDGFPTLDILQRITNEATASHVKNLILVKIHNQMKDMTKTETKRKLGYLTVEQAEDFKKVKKQRSSGSGLTMEVQDVNDEQDYHHEALENIARAIEPDVRQNKLHEARDNSRGDLALRTLRNVPAGQDDKFYGKASQHEPKERRGHSSAAAQQLKKSAHNKSGRNK